MATKPTKQQVAQAKARAGGNDPMKFKLSKKQAKDLALNAAMFVGPGKFVKGVELAAKAARVVGLKKEVEVAKVVRKYQLKSSLVKKAITKKNTQAAAKTVVKKEASAGDVLRSAKAEGQATTAKKLDRAVKFKPKSQAERGVTSPARPPREIGPQFPKKTDVTYEGKGMPVKVSTRKPRPKKTGLKTTTGQRRAKVSDVDAKDVSKELRARPNAPRSRDVVKPGSTTLTANEKALIKVKQPVEIRNVEPKSLQQIKDAKAAEKLARTNKLLRRPKTRKVEGPKTEHQTKVVENAKKDVPRVPSHKVYVKIMRKKKWKPDTSNAGAGADRTTRSAGKGEKGAYVRQPYKSKAEIREEGNNANTAENTFAAKPKSDISQGRGNAPQPKPIIPKELTRTERRAARADRKRQAKHRRSGGNDVVIPQKNRNLIRRDANGKPIRDSNGDLIVNADRRTRRVYPRTASVRPNAKKQEGKVFRHRVKVAEKEVMAAERSVAKTEVTAAKKSTAAGAKYVKKTRARLSKTRPLRKP
jgi:hypothetical protein